MAPEQGHIRTLGSLETLLVASSIRDACLGLRFGCKGLGFLFQGWGVDWLGTQRNE